MNQDRPRFPAMPPPAMPPPRPSGSSSSPPGDPGQGVSKNGWAVASLVLGIIGLCFPLLSILALIFGLIARQQIDENPLQDGEGLAVAGVVLGIIGIVLLVLSLVVLLANG